MDFHSSISFEFHYTEQAASPLLFMTQLDCELRSTITLSRPAVLHHSRGSGMLYSLPCWAPQTPPWTLTSSSGQWSQLMAFVWTNSLCWLPFLLHVTQSCFLVYHWSFSSPWVSLTISVHTHIRLWASCRCLTRGVQPGLLKTQTLVLQLHYSFSFFKNSFPFLQEECKSLYIFLCLLPPHSTPHYLSL